MTIRRNLTAAWSSDIPTTRDTPIQCRRGIVYVNWAASGPVDTTDGFTLGSGDAMVIPAGNTFRLCTVSNGAGGAADHEVFYESYLV